MTSKLRFNLFIYFYFQVTHWHNPNFFAYFSAAQSFPAMLADMLSGAIGCIGFSWVSDFLPCVSSACCLKKRDHFFLLLSFPCSGCQSGLHRAGDCDDGLAGEDAETAWLFSIFWCKQSGRWRHSGKIKNSPLLKRVLSMQPNFTSYRKKRIQL